MVQSPRRRPAPSNHWSQIGRALVARVRGMGREERAAAVREVAGRHGLSVHTVQRYAVLAEFLNTLGVGEGSSGRLAVAQTEILLRVWALDPTAAIDGLRRLDEGALSYKGAVQLERRARDQAAKRRTGEAPPSERSVEPLGAPDLGRWARGWTVASAVVVEPIGDERFPFVQVHRMVAFAEGRIAFVDEGAMSSGPQHGYEFMTLARTVLAASALFDRVVVLVALRSSIGPLSRLLELCASSVANRVFLDLDRFDDDGSGSATDP